MFKKNKVTNKTLILVFDGSMLEVPGVGPNSIEQYLSNDSEGRLIVNTKS